MELDISGSFDPIAKTLEVFHLESGRWVVADHFLEDGRVVRIAISGIRNQFK